MTRHDTSRHARGLGARLWRAGVVFGAVLFAGSGLAAERARPDVIFAGKLEPSTTARGRQQRLVLDLATVWTGCDADLMRRTLAADVDFSYPTNRVIGIEAAVADLKVFCGKATDRSIYFPADAFYLDPRNHRIAAELQFRVTEDGARQVINDVWIATVSGGRIAVIKEYLDGRVKTLQAQGVLSRQEGAPFLTPWPPKMSTTPAAPAP